ncbi:hypothetical protein [Medusavirus stheno T3]|uniref:Uncharacterized protein n=1 Tax=Medusavirus stheno T3 TaxID=3069717 RepID=A0A7S7YEH2_9VIRU|nr:hypothetical protein QKU73_gp112 [Acanthamoeba castellanii medusavirus]QPB44293.1 hypothetical protein [Medusavirus stheno T3]
MQTSTKRARSESEAPKTTTVTIVTKDDVHFPVDVSLGQFASEQYPHFRTDAGPVRIDISANDFRPLHTALTSLPFDRTSDSYRKNMVAVCAHLALADEPIDQWHQRCDAAARELNIAGLLDAIQGVYAKHNSYVKDRIEKHVPPVASADGFVDVVWRFKLRRTGVAVDAERTDKIIDALIGGPSTKSAEVVLPRFSDSVRMPVQDEEQRCKVWREFAESLPVFDRTKTTVFHYNLEVDAKLLEAWRPFLDLTRSLCIIPGAYDRAVAYADSFLHVHTDQSLKAPLAAMKDVYGVELDNPFHLFVALSGNVGWWTSAASELLLTAYKNDTKIVSLVLDAEARFGSNLPRRCSRSNRICLETQLARAALERVPEFEVREFTAKLTNDYFAHWPYYER